MISLLIMWLAVGAFALAMALIVDLQPQWLNPQRLTNWPFKDMPATNGIIFVGIFFTVAIGVIMLFGTKGLGWI